MRRNVCIIFFIVFCLFICGCDSAEVEIYPQSILAKPDSIQAENGSSVLIYEKGEETCEALYAVLTQNWWMTAEGEPAVAENADLMMVGTVDELVATSESMDRHSDDIIISFCYDREPLQWAKSDGTILDIKRVAFVIPEYTEGGSNVHGFFTISRTENIGINEGVFTYYYPAEMVERFWNYQLDVQEETQSTVQPTLYSQEMAMLEGFVVMQDGDVRHNAGSWFAFLEKAQAGESCAVTVVQFTQEAYIRYDIDYDGHDYTVTFEKDGQTVSEASQVLVIDSGLCSDSAEPYDYFESYLLNDIVLYRDRIAQPDYEGVTEIFLHTKEGEPPIRSYTESAELEAILQLLMMAEYAPVEPEEYIYGMKLLMTNRDGKEQVIELDLNQGYYRYGMQTYRYGEVKDMLAALGLTQWPESVQEEFAQFLK